MSRFTSASYTYFKRVLFSLRAKPRIPLRIPVVLFASSRLAAMGFADAENEPPKMNTNHLHPSPFASPNSSNEGLKDTKESNEEEEERKEMLKQRQREFAKTRREAIKSQQKAKALLGKRLEELRANPEELDFSTRFMIAAKLMTKGSYDFSPKELRYFNGFDGRNIYISIRGTVYDVSSHESGRGFYGPTSTYFLLSGRDATIQLAKMDLTIENPENISESTLSEEELATLNHWEEVFKKKYKVIGTLTPK